MDDSEPVDVPASNPPLVAYKEWAAIVAALAGGAQTLLLRKGGIHEGRAGFRVEHQRFWLLPTRFHQSTDELTSDGSDWLAEAQRQQPPEGWFRLHALADVQQVWQLADLTSALRLSGLHHWSEQTVRQRFAYRDPGLFVLLVRVWTVSAAWELPDRPVYAGCRSWVPLLPEDAPAPALLDTAVPALTDDQFSALAGEIRARLGTHST